MTICATVLLVATALPASAAEGEGRYAAKGPGRESCQAFVEARAGRSPTYPKYLGWIEGYLTAANRYEPDSYDVAPWGGAALYAIILHRHCQENPDQRFAVAVQGLVDSSKNDRLTEPSRLITLQTEDGPIMIAGEPVEIYAEVLRRMQVELAEMGLYSGAADGRFNPETRDALALYETSEGLPGDGIPDPITVWKLMTQ